MTTNAYRHRIATIARNRAVGAMNGALVWIVHPSYNTKGGVLAELDAADTMLLAVAEADGVLGAQYVAGIDRYALDAVRRAIKARKPSEPLNLHPEVAAAVVGDADQIAAYNLGD